jgi:drug/metabolite transporter (DMT)-like permease
MKQLEIIAVWTLFFGSSVFGHVALKRAAGVSSDFEYAKVLGMWKDPWAVTAVASWVLSSLLWALLLTRFEVSEAAGHSSLRYVLILLLAVFWLGESLSTRQVAGAVFIMLGIWLTAKP